MVISNRVLIHYSSLSINRKQCKTSKTIHNLVWTKTPNNYRMKWKQHESSLRVEQRLKCYWFNCMDSIPFYLVWAALNKQDSENKHATDTNAYEIPVSDTQLSWFPQIWRWKRESGWKNPKTLSARHWDGSDVWVMGGFTSNLRDFLRICLGSIQRQMVSHRSCLCMGLKP